MFTLPELPFDPKAFGTFTSAETFEYHHGKHHAGYVKKLNAVIEGTPYAQASLEDVIASSRRDNNAAIFNNAAQHFNHAFFWNCLSPSGGELSGAIKAAIERDLGSVGDFKKSFSDAAATLFGSGWAWLVKTNDGALAVRQYKNAETPAGTEDVPLLTLDVWEHAYYIDHRNDRARFIEQFWSHVNWEFVGSQLK